MPTHNPLPSTRPMIREDAIGSRGSPREDFHVRANDFLFTTDSRDARNNLYETSVFKEFSLYIRPDCLKNVCRRIIAYRYSAAPQSVGHSSVALRSPRIGYELRTVVTRESPRRESPPAVIRRRQNCI